MRNKFLTKILGATLGLAMALGVGVGVVNYNNKTVKEVNAEYAICETCDFTTKSYFPSSSNYTGTWTYGDFTVVHGNNNGTINSHGSAWAYMKFGPKKSKAADDAKEDDGYVKSGKIESSVARVGIQVAASTIGDGGTTSTVSWGVKVYSDSDFSNLVESVSLTAITYQTAGTYYLEPSGEEWSANKYYQIQIHCVNDTTTNGLVWVEKVIFYRDAGGAPVLSGISVNDAPTKTVYNAGENFDPTGLTITRTYSNSSSDTYSYADHAADFTFNPTTSTRLTTSNNSVTISYGGFSTSQSITVNSVPEPAVEEKSIAQFIALENNAYRAYSVTASIKSFYNDSKVARGDLTLTDGVNDLRVYRSTITASALAWSSDTASYSYNDLSDFVSNPTTNNLEVGTTITMKLIRADYNSTIQANGVITWIQPIEATDISLNRDTATIDINESLELVPSFTPANATPVLTWESSDDSIATVDDGVVTGVSEGVVTITARVSDDIKDECEVTVTKFLKAVLKSNSASDSATANSYVGDALAEILNLNANVFSVVYNKNNASSEMALRTDGIRLYGTKKTTNGNKFTVSIDGNYRIDTIKIAFDDGYSATAVISSSKVSSITPTDGVYDIKDTEFTVFNDNSSVNSNTQVRFQKIEIRYRTAYAEVAVGQLSTNSALSYNYVKNGENDFTFSNVKAKFGGYVTKELWDNLNDETTIQGYGVMISTSDTEPTGYIGNNNFKDEYAVAISMAEGDIDDAIDLVCTGTKILNFYKSGTPYLHEAAEANYTEDTYAWNLVQSINTDHLTRTYVAIAYIRTSTGLVFLEEERTSVRDIADRMVDSGDYDESPLLESLSYLAGL